ncbi:MAG TPA: hypothetical protein VLX44_20060 [Xanthobacteraceae bacterium]|nr:hypothetical protein [Xanthobacteraceae bacterium]
MPRSFQNPAATRLKIAFTVILIAAVVALTGLYAQLAGDPHGLLVWLVAGLTLAAMVALAADPLTDTICVRLLRPRRRNAAPRSEPRFAALAIVVAVRIPRAARRIRGA